MEGGVNLAQMLVGNMGVALGGDDGFVAEQLLDAAQVGAGAEQISGK
ncbi:MAG: hypothetical protein CEN88_336, partial [Candidatus Berkelbacteria bacterium Licking1014_2]